MRLFANPTDRQVAVGLLLVRAITGVVMAAHGAQKVFMMGIPAITQGFTQMGVPMPGVTAPLVSILELAGGIAIVIGLLTRLAALGLAIDMFSAFALVHVKAGFYLPMGFEFVLLLGVLLSALVVMGAGPYSVDGAIAARDRG